MSLDLIDSTTYRTIRAPFTLLFLFIFYHTEFDSLTFLSLSISNFTTHLTVSSYLILSHFTSCISSHLTSLHALIHLSIDSFAACT